MALSNALYAGLSGLDVNQTKLNVVGNNIANVNTVAFKSSRVLFKPQFYLTDSGGSQPSDDFGGTNPSQRGLGAVVASTDRDFTPGSIETTGRDTDLAIDGDGFFVVDGGGTQRYTRDGSFKRNSLNDLVNSSGDYVMGYGVDDDFSLVPNQLTRINIPLGTLTTAQATTQANLSGNLNADGVVASGASIVTTQYFTTAGNTAPTNATLLTDLIDTNTSNPAFTSGQVFDFEAGKGGGTGQRVGTAQFNVGAGTTVNDLLTFFQQRLGINTAVPDDGNPLTAPPGATLENDPANTQARILIAGNLGEANKLTVGPGSFTDAVAGGLPLDFNTGTTAGGIADGAVGESIRTDAIFYDSLGTPVSIAVTMVLESVTSAGGTTWRYFAEAGEDLSPTVQDLVVGTGTISFNNLGKPVPPTNTLLTVSRDGTGAATPLTVQLNFDPLRSFTARTSTVDLAPVDGFETGTLESFTIGANGIITGNFTNSQRRNLGQIAVAKFANAQGLLDQGGNLYGAGPNSGTPIVGAPMEFGTGAIVAGSLELSNVDLSEEFINLIIASTGFSAASRVITTSDQLITELLNTSR